MLWRIESRYGFGAYTSGAWNASGAFNPDYCPTPHLPCEEGLGDKVTREHIFGFATLRQAQRWCTRDMVRDAHEVGCVLALYRGPIDRSPTQAIGRKDQLQIIHAWPLTEDMQRKIGKRE